MKIKRYLDFVSEKLNGYFDLNRQKDLERNNISNFEIPERIEKHGLSIKFSIHAKSQAKNRRDDLNSNDWEIMSENILNFLHLSNPKNGHYLFFSKKYQQGIVGQWIRPFAFLIITILPKGKNNVKPGTNMIVLEGVEYDLKKMIEDTCIVIELE